MKTPTGLIIVPFANQIDNSIIIKNNRVNYIIDVNKLEVEDIDSNLIKSISKKRLIIQKLSSLDKEIYTNSLSFVNNKSFIQNDDTLDVSNERTYVKMFELYNKLRYNNNNNYNTFHIKSEKRSKLADVAKDLDAVKDHGVYIESENEIGYIMNKGETNNSNTSNKNILKNMLKVLSAVHKRGVIVGHTELYNGKIDILTAEYYAGVDPISNLQHLVERKELIKKYNNDTMRLFKLATVFDTYILCNSIDSNLIKKDVIINYINSDLKEWFADIILQSFLTDSKTKKIK